MHTHLISAGTIKGETVQNLMNEDIGKIEDLMLDLHKGQIGYVVLSFGGFLGMGDKFFAVPWSALEVDTTNNVVRLDVSEERLEKMEGFDKDNWPDFADTSFLHLVNKNTSGIGRHTYTSQ